MIRSEHLSFKRMELEDVFQFKNWGKHETSMFDDYNFIEETDEDIQSWFNWKTETFRAIYFTIFLKDKAIGYISFKNMSSLLKTAELGIVLDPNYINKGYGYEALKTMFEYYFNDLKNKKIYLDVAKYNKRAYHLYLKLGFEKYSSTIMKYPNDKLDKKSKDYIENKEAFLSVFGILFFTADRLVLTKERFEEIK